jgi:hypothetical protein
MTYSVECGKSQRGMFMADGQKSKSSEKESYELLRKSKLYQEFLAEKEEILKHKWIESEKVGHDIGYDKAFFDWELKHYRKWKEEREGRKKLTA